MTTIVGFGLALLAGVLSTLSPCVLPLLPIVLGTAAGEHRFGPVALAGGLALSFVTVGLFVATVGFSIGLDDGVFRLVAAIILLGLGVVLLVPRLQTRIAFAGGPIADWVQSRFGGPPKGDWRGQFGVGLLLGAVWSPCVGPTLGAASVLAARGQHLAEVVLTMTLFGLGAALPLLILGALSRRALLRWRSRLAGAGAVMRSLLGLVLIVTAGAILSGLDRRIEAGLVTASPDWLTGLTTRF
jgi:cytochrome c biogenesis protein CcdA